MEKHILLGKRTVAVHLASDKQALRFDVEGEKPSIARADGDCCSFSWIESLDAPGALLGTVTAVENLDMPDLGSGAEQTMSKTESGECIKYYGCKITTEKGACVIDYRNDSNGYYGGSLSWDGEPWFYGGVFKQNKSNEDWKQIAPA